MKRILILLFGCLLLSAGVTPAGDDTGWYAGATAGLSTNGDLVSANDDGSLSMIDEDDDDTSFRALGGYKFTPNVGVEASYADNGETSFTAMSDGSGESWDAGSVATNFESSAFSAMLMGWWPVTDRFSLFAGVGVSSWETTEEFTENGVVTEVDDNSGTDLTYTAGFEYDPRNEDDWVLRTEYTAGDVDDDGDNVESLRVGAVFRF